MKLVLWLVGATFVVGLAGMALVQLDARNGDMPEGPGSMPVGGN